MRLNRRGVIGIVAAFAALLGLILFEYKREYPYGARPATLPIVLMALDTYAMEHGGNFPNVDGDPYRSLQALYPRYLGPEYLAGISGDRSAVTRTLLDGGPLNSNICSWVYEPGFSISNQPDIAIIWDRAPGIAFSGRAIPGRRIVGLISGGMKEIPQREWQLFLSEQAQIRTRTRQPKNQSTRGGKGS